MQEQDFLGLLGCTVDGRYAVEQQVGEGGFGVVFRALDLGRDRHVAMKFLKTPPFATPEATSKVWDIFRTEVDFLRRLDGHASIVRIHHVGQLPTEQGLAAYMVLEWLEGSDLQATLIDERARGRVYNEFDAVRLLLPVVDAIAYAHAKGIVHGDIKPSNILVLRDSGQPKVVDFGSAQRFDQVIAACLSESNTGSGFNIFSAAYAAPEQFYLREFGTTGPWTDVFALGVVLSDIVTGRWGLGDDRCECLLNSVAGLRPTPRNFGAIVSDEFEALVAKAVATYREDRFSDAGELAEAMCAHLELEPTLASRVCEPVRKPKALAGTLRIAPTR